MGAIEEVHEELETDIALEDFRERVEAKVEEMGGLADDETAAMLVAHELEGDRPIDIAAVQAEMDTVTVLGVVKHVGDVRTFDRDDGSSGAVVNVELADESGTTRAAFWDDMAEAAVEELERGDTLRLKARPRDGLNGLELSVTDVRLEEDLEVAIEEPDVHAIGDLEPGVDGVHLVGEVLRVESVRTFQRDDGSEGRVATVVLGDDTDAVSVSLWDDATAAVEHLQVGETARVLEGSTRERDGRLEVHVGRRGAVEPVDDDVTYQPTAEPIEGLEEDDIATIAGIVRSTDPVRRFDRDDGTEGKVRNIRLQDETGSIRVALWGARADLEVAPGDEVTCVDVTIQEGFRDDLEASANWRSTVVQRGSTRTASPTPSTEPDDPTGTVEFTGTVVQPGDPIILDDGTETVCVDYHGDVDLGERVTVRGTRAGERIDADELEPASRPT